MSQFTCGDCGSTDIRYWTDESGRWSECEKCKSDYIVDPSEESRNWRVRFKREDGYYCFLNIKKKAGEPVCRQEVEEWAAIQLERNPDYQSVSEIINEEAEETA